MNDIADEPIDGSKTEVTQEEVNLQQKDAKAPLSPVSNDNSNLLVNVTPTSISEKIVSLPLENESPTVISLSDPKNIQDPNHKRVVSVIVMQIILLIVMISVTVGYGWFHNVPHALTVMFGGEDIEVYSEAIAKYNFVGVSPENPLPSFFSVMIEAGIWSFAGVLARSEYNLTQIVIRRKDLKILEMISKLIGDIAMGVAIAMAVVAFLRSTELVNLTLKTADVGAIAAISFILGFYHEDTRRLLGSLRSKVAGTTDEPSEDEKTE